MADIEQEISDDDEMSLKSLSESLKTVEKHLFPKTKKKTLNNYMRVRHTICYFISTDKKRLVSSDEWIGVYLDGNILHCGKEYNTLRSFISAHHSLRKNHRCQCLPIDVECEGIWMPYTVYFNK